MTEVCIKRLDMPDPPSEKDPKLKHAILREVYRDNLGKSANEPSPPPGSQKTGIKFLLLTLIPALGLLGYFFFLLPGAWDRPPAEHAPSMQNAGPAPAEVAAPEASDVAGMNAQTGLNQRARETEKAPSTGPPAPDTDIAGTALVPQDPFAPLELEAPLEPTGHQEPPLPPLLAAAQGPVIDETLPADYQALVDASGFSLAQLFGLGVKTIVIDAGHGGRDPGATGAGGLQEKDITLDIARRLRNRLEKYPNYRILMTRDEDVKISTRQRVAFANAQKADLFISIHVNSLLKGQQAIIETYYFGAQTDEQSLRLAEAENQGSEYLMAEFKGMIKKIGDTFKQQESKALATYIQNSLFKNLKKQNDQLANRGTKMAPFVVLLGADMPSVLAEITCISNPDEERKLATDSYRETFAKHLESGIVAYLNQSRTRENLTKGALKNGQKGTDGKG